MIIKYCPSCIGRPYTDDMTTVSCPNCGSQLESEFVSDLSSLMHRKKLNRSDTESDGSSWFGVGSEPEDEEEDDFLKELLGEKDPESKGDFKPSNLPESDGTFHPPDMTDDGGITTLGGKPKAAGVKRDELPPLNNRKSSTKVIYGRVADYSSSGREDGNYRRLFFQRISDYFLYGQKMEDVLHRFYVKNRDEDAMGYSRSSSELVNVHGTIGGGVSINNNDEVEVHGKYNRDGVFMAREIFVTTDGNHLRVRFQNSPSQMTNSVLVIIALIMVVFTLFHFNGNIFAGFSFFLKSWLAMAVIITVLYFVLFSRLAVARMFFGRKAFPLGSILIISFIATLVYLNWNGIGTSIFSGLWSLLSSVLSTVIVIALIIIAFKNIIKP